MGVARDKHLLTSGYLPTLRSGLYKNAMLNLYLVLAFVTIILLDPQALTVSVAKSAGSTTAHTSFHSDAISRNYQARARPLITLSSGEYDNTEGGETSSRDSDHYGDEEESTSTGRSFSLEDCARLLTSTAPPDSGVTSSRTIGGGGFAIRIAGMPTKYLHGESYTGKDSKVQCHFVSKLTNACTGVQIRGKKQGCSMLLYHTTR